MNIQHRLNGTTLHVGLIGELDESHAAFVREHSDERFEKCKISEAIIDMSELSFMDSTGIGVLIGRYKALKNKGVRLFVERPARAVDKVLSLTGIYKIIPKIC